MSLAADCGLMTADVPPMRADMPASRAGMTPMSAGTRTPAVSPGMPTMPAIPHGMLMPTTAAGMPAVRASRAGMRQRARGLAGSAVGGAIALVAAALVAVLWANVAPASYALFWDARFVVGSGGAMVELPLRDWVNSGLMTLFFFAVGLEARHTFDLGELRDRSKIVLPLVAGATGMLIPVAIYLAATAGQDAARGWGAAMSTDTAFALGLLALFGSRLPTTLRTFLLTVAVVDDAIALLVITLCYSGIVSVSAAVAAAAVFAVVLVARARGVRAGGLYALLGAAVWLLLLRAGLDPVISGLGMGLVTAAYPAARPDLEQASTLFRRFREHPSAELQRELQRGLATVISANDRLQARLHPWTTFVIVPLFAVANAGVALDVSGLERAARSPITWGIVLAYLVGKPLGIVGAARLTAWASRGRWTPPVGWGAAAAGGATAAVGFTVSLLIATLAFSGEELEQAKVGVLAAAVGSLLMTWLATSLMERLPREACLVAQLGTATPPVDLVDPVDTARDRVRGPADAVVTIVEYGDYDCPHCGRAEHALRSVLTERGDVRYVWRHLPLVDVHPHAQLAAEAVEAAAAQGHFWPMHDLLLAHVGPLRELDLVRFAKQLRIDVGRFHRDLCDHLGASRIASDVASADRGGVAGTPTFFVNGRRFPGVPDAASLVAAVDAARDRAALSPRVQ